MVDAPIEAVTARDDIIPTDLPEADGTLAWTEATLVTAAAVGETGPGYGYAAAAAAPLVLGRLAIAPERSRPGLGLASRAPDAERFAT